MKKKLAFIMALLMVLPMFASCSDNGASTTDTATTTETTQVSADTAEVEEGDTSFKANVPEGTNLGGITFTVLAYPNDGGIWGDVDWSAEELTGETLNDAVYKRTMQVEDELNIKIETAYGNGTGDTATITSAVNAGMDAYQVVNMSIMSAFNVAQKGTVMELNTYSDNGTLDLTSAWWDQNCIKDLAVSGKNFILTGDIGTMYKKSIAVIMFNKAILSQHTDLSDPYELMANKEWTIDTMVQMGSQVSEDLDGNGTMDANDRYGLITFCDMMGSLFISCGIHFTEKNENGIPELTFYSDKSVGVMEKVAELMYDPDHTWSWSKAGTGENPAFTMYQQDQALFYYGELHAVATMRDMDSEFGILPLPMYDSSQDGYHHSINPNVADVYVIPVTNVSYESSGYILDSLGAASKNILTPAYNEVNLKGKVSRDEESLASLDIIFSTVNYDIGHTGGIGITSMLNSMADGYNSDLASKWQQNLKPVTKLLTKMTDAFSAE